MTQKKASFFDSVLSRPTMKVDLGKCKTYDCVHILDTVVGFLAISASPSHELCDSSLYLQSVQVWYSICLPATSTASAFL